jgi:hypothetical protein
MLVEQAAPATGLPATVAPSSVAARLADGLIRSMAIARAKLAAWATAAVLLVGTAAGVGLYQPAGAQPKGADAAPTPLVDASAQAKDAEKNLATLVLRISLAPAGEGKFDPKYSLYHVLMYVPNLRLEPPANGPDGKPTEAYARITKEEAKKVLDALWNMGFFDGRTLPQAGGFGHGNGFGPGSPMGSSGHTGFGPRPGGGFPPEPAKVDRTAPHALVTLRYQGGEDPTQRELVCPWGADMLKLLDGIRACVEGDGAKALDRLLAQLSDERKKWAPDPLAEDLKRLQGSWAVHSLAEHEIIDPNEGPVARLTIDGKRITLKAHIQYKPRLDTDMITGTFELVEAGGSRKLVIRGTRDTISKQEQISWSLPYEFVGNQLRLVLPASVAGPPAPDPKTGIRQLVFTRQLPATTSEWGEASHGVQARIRTAKTKFAPGQAPTFDFDVRDTHAGLAGKPWHWQAPRVGEAARVEVDGVWYKYSDRDLKKFGAEQLALGQTVEKWATVALTDDWWAVANGSGLGLPMRLRLTPGKHKVRVAYDFFPSVPEAAAAAAVSGVLEIEIVTADGRSPDTASPWGKPSEGLCLRIRSDTDRLGAFPGPTIAVDVKLEPSPVETKPTAWSAVPDWQFARLEVDGVWYQARDRLRDFIAPREVRPSGEIKDWAEVPLGAAWVDERAETAERPVLRLAPGKHTVRVSYTFWKASQAMTMASPVSGPLEIVVPGEVPKVGANESKWGEPTGGIRARIRTAKPRYIVGEAIRIDYDVKADAKPANRNWSAGIVGAHARVQVDGTWYVFNATTYEFPIKHALSAGQEVAPWTMVRLDRMWVAEKTDPAVELVLNPGKHTLRVEFAFESDSTKPPTACPVSGPLEIEVMPETTTDIGWRPQTTWKPFAGAAVVDLAAPDQKHLFTAGKTGLTVWDLSGKEPKAGQIFEYAFSGIQFAGLDGDGQPLLLRRTTREHPMGPLQADLSVARLSDLNENLKPQFGVMADSLRAWAVRPDGKVIAVLLTGWKDVRLVNVNTGMDRVLEAPKETADRFAFPHGLLWSPDGRLLVGLGSNDYPVTGKMNGMVVCWNAETGKVIWQAEEPDGQSVGAMSRDGRVLVTSGRLGKRLNVWELATGKKIGEPSANGVTAIGVSPDGKTVAAGTFTDTDPRMPVLEIWDLSLKAPSRHVRVPAAVQSIAFCPDGRAFATADQSGEVRWWVREN